MSGITFLTSADDVPRIEGSVFRAGGTDLQERLRARNESPHILDLTGIEGFAGIERSAAGTVVGAGTRLAVVASELLSYYPALAITAGGLATPQIRAVGTLGGNLLQRTRCWYFRHPHVECFKTGGNSCPARSGRHLYGVAFDRSECVHPHPSSTAMALLIYDATVTIAGRDAMSVADLLGDGADPTRDNLLGEGEVLTSIMLPPPWPDERAAYFRAISRFEAEWPIVEAVCRVKFDADGQVADCGIGLGGVATVPLRMTAAEDLLRGSTLDADTIGRVSAQCADSANPVPEASYKVGLIEATVREVLEQIAPMGQPGGSPPL